MRQKNCQNPDMERLRPVLPDYGVRIESHQHGPTFSTGMHAHKYTSLIYIVSGQGRCITADKEYELFGNTAILLKRGQNHQLVDKPRRAMTVFVLYFLREAVEVGENIITALLSSNEPLRVPLYYAEQIRRTLRQMLYEQNSKPAGFQIAIKQCLAMIILQTYRAKCRHSETAETLATRDNSRQVAAVLDYVSTNYYEQHSLSDAARMAQMSQRQFTNLCRKQTGKSFIQFLNFIRTERAKELLEKTTLPVAAIAFEVGFEELSTFYRAFKKHQGLNPLGFRQ